VPPYKIIPVTVNKTEMVFEVYHSLHNLKSYSLLYGFMWLHRITRAVQALPAADKWRHANYCPQHTKPKKCSTMDTTATIFSGESHKCATDNRIWIPEAKRIYRTDHSVQRHSYATHQHVIHPVCTNKASVNEPNQYGYYTLRIHMDTHVRVHIDT
jgi:hypothetical protein